jgi:hypothetical protein
MEPGPNWRSPVSMATTPCEGLECVNLQNKVSDWTGRKQGCSLRETSMLIGLKGNKDVEWITKKRAC